MKYIAAFAVLLCMTLTARAQVLPFNDAGVTMGHHHLMVADVEAHIGIWADALGGELSGNPGLQFVKYPGTFLILTERDGREGTNGSSLDYIAFTVRDLDGTRAKLAEAGVGITSVSATRFDAMMPGDIDVQFYADPALTTPIVHRAMGLVSTDPDAQRAWWEDILGAWTNEVDGQRISSIPGSQVFFARSGSALAPTSGRALDHTGIGVPDVQEFCAQVAEKGVECSFLRDTIATITDPAGVMVEVNQGLESR